MVNHNIDDHLFDERLEERPLLKIILENCTKIVMGGVVDCKTYEEKNYINIMIRKYKNLFMIVELIAVIVVLTIILVIAI